MSDRVIPESNAESGADAERRRHPCSEAHHRHLIRRLRLRKLYILIIEPHFPPPPAQPNP